MLKGDLVSCRLQYGDEAMVKKGQSNFKTNRSRNFLYIVCWGYWEHLIAIIVEPIWALQHV